MVRSLNQLADGVEWVPMITQEEGQENLQLEGKETGGSQHLWPGILISAVELDFLKQYL